MLNPAPAGGARPLGPLARRRADAQPRRARRARRPATRGARAAPTSGAEDPIRAAQHAARGDERGTGRRAARSSSRSARAAPSSSGAAAPPSTSRRREVTAVDATGAGDTLNGALAAALAEGRDIEAAARRAVVAASLSVTRAGCARGDADAGGAGRGRRPLSGPPLSRLPRRASATHGALDPRRRRHAEAAVGVDPPGGEPARPRLVPDRAAAREEQRLGPHLGPGGSAAATVTASRPVVAGAPVAGSIRWWTARPSGSVPAPDAARTTWRPRRGRSRRPRAGPASRIGGRPGPRSRPASRRSAVRPRRARRRPRRAGGPAPAPSDRQRARGRPAEREALADPAGVDRRRRAPGRGAAAPGRRRRSAGVRARRPSAGAPCSPIRSSASSDRGVEPAAGDPPRPIHDRQRLAQPPRDRDDAPGAGQPVERGQLAVRPEPRQGAVDGVELGADRARQAASRGPSCRRRPRRREPDEQPQLGPERPRGVGEDGIAGRRRDRPTPRAAGAARDAAAISRRRRASWWSAAGATRRDAIDSVDAHAGQLDPSRQGRRRAADLRHQRRQLVELRLVRGDIRRRRADRARECSGRASTAAREASSASLRGARRGDRVEVRLATGGERTRRRRTGAWRRPRG